ncbi:hypothetical protein OHA40_30705 [Nocardia sp. NBC_00508]|uniref:hypothetical protein n=1 Tax=Nocardia sp. NBC_00508 TaxID=2975992 RepID=UPI002E805D7C|nr:hypothetical protein [Nocardia sp. NBC_00508]WUD65907.1 hypothetical protein OHA40_30705 [Nocardia sp. NBC_00508]
MQNSASAGWESRRTVALARAEKFIETQAEHNEAFPATVQADLKVRDPEFRSHRPSHLLCRAAALGADHGEQATDRGPDAGDGVHRGHRVIQRGGQENTSHIGVL